MFLGEKVFNEMPMFSNSRLPSCSRTPFSRLVWPIYIGDTRVNDLADISTQATIGERFFKMVRVTGVLTEIAHVAPKLDAVGDVDLNTSADTAVICAVDEDDLFNLSNSSSFIFDVEPEMLGQEVEVIYRESGDKPSSLDDKDTVYDVMATGTSDVYETTMDAITIAPSNENKPADYSVDTSDEDYNPMTIQFEGYNGNRAKVLDEKFTLPVITNLYEGKALKNEDVTAAVKQADWNRNVYVVSDLDTINMLATTSTAPVRLIDYDRDGTLDIAFVTTPYYGTVSSYNADRYEFTTDATIDGDDISTLRRQENFETSPLKTKLKGRRHRRHHRRHLG